MRETRHTRHTGRPHLKEGTTRSKDKRCIECVCEYFDEAGKLLANELKTMATFFKYEDIIEELKNSKSFLWLITKSSTDYKILGFHTPKKVYSPKKIYSPNCPSRGCI